MPETKRTNLLHRVADQIFIANCFTDDPPGRATPSWFDHPWLMVTTQLSIQACYKERPRYRPARTPSFPSVPFSSPFLSTTFLLYHLTLTFFQNLILVQHVLHSIFHRRPLFILRWCLIRPGQARPCRQSRVISHQGTSSVFLVTRISPADSICPFQPQSFTSTAWGGTSKSAGNSGLRLYYATGGGIQELIAADGGLLKESKDQKWSRGAFLKDDAFTVADSATIQAVNTYNYGYDELQVYFVTENGASKTIRNWEYSGGSWRLGGLALESPNYDMGSMSVNAYDLGSESIFAQHHRIL